MPQFILDTSGEVQPPASAKLWPHPLNWSQLDAFTQAYIEAMFFTETDPGRDSEQFALDLTYELDHQGESIPSDRALDGAIPNDVGFADLAPEALNSILADCADFQRAYRPLWAGEAYLATSDTPTDAQAGHDFWLTRNRHGAGFWDRDESVYGDNAQALTQAAHAAGECYVSTGEDGKVHVG